MPKIGNYRAKCSQATITWKFSCDKRGQIVTERLLLVLSFIPTFTNQTSPLLGTEEGVDSIVVVVSMVVEGEDEATSSVTILFCKILLQAIRRRLLA